MKSFETFYFTEYSFDPETFRASFSYTFDHEVNFTENIDFACPELKAIDTVDPEIMQTLLFHLSLALGISYYKLYPTKTLVVETGILNEDQQQFWETFYTQGLGEFFFTNKLSPKDFISFVNGDKQISQKMFSSNSTTPMIALGGGKDSLVSVEIIKKLNIPFYTSTFGKDYYLHRAVNDII